MKVHERLPPSSGWHPRSQGPERPHESACKQHRRDDQRQSACASQNQWHHRAGSRTNVRLDTVMLSTLMFWQWNYTQKNVGWVTKCLRNVSVSEQEKKWWGFKRGFAHKITLKWENEPATKSLEEFDEWTLMCPHILEYKVTLIQLHQQHGDACRCELMVSRKQVANQKDQFTHSTVMKLTNSVKCTQADSHIRLDVCMKWSRKTEKKSFDDTKCVYRRISDACFTLMNALECSYICSQLHFKV